jgi:O-antigen/teichoic acid export membrane protein
MTRPARTPPSPVLTAMTHPPPTPGRLVAHPRDLAVRVGFNGLAQFAPIVVTVAITPMLLHRLGLDRFGIWSLALVMLSTLTSLDGGVSASLARFFAMYAAHGDRADSARLLLASVLLFVAVGLVLTVAAFLLAPALVGLFDIPSGLRGEAAFVLRWLPPLVVLALMGDATAALLQGNGQFRALAATMVASSATFAVAVILLVQPGAHLRALILATAVRYAGLVVVGLAFAARHVSIGRPLLPSRVTVRELGRYASRMQLSAVTGFVNSQLDALVIAAVLPVRYVGLYSVGLQAAAATRSLPLYVFAPVLTRLTTTFRNEGRAATTREFERLERKWLPAALGYGVVTVAAIGLSVPIWLGDLYGLSGAVAAVLLAGYMVHVGLTGMRTCYVRAVGRPGLEARYSLVWTVGNSVLTVPLTILAGVVGVVAATAATGIVASLYFVNLCARTERLAVIRPGRRWLGVAVIAAGLTVTGELAIVQTNMHGFLALGLAGVPALVGLGIVAAGIRHAPSSVSTGRKVWSHVSR